MRRPSRPLVVLCALIWLSAGGAARAARADDFQEAVKEFRAALKDPSISARGEAYTRMAFWDSAEAVQAMLAALGKETNPAVQRMALRAIGSIRTPEGRKAQRDALKAAKGDMRHLLLLAVAEAGGVDAELEALLRAELAGKDPASAALAAAALGTSRSPANLPVLLTAAAHADGRVRAAAAFALERMANPPSPEPQPGQPVPEPLPAPDEMKTPESRSALVAALAASDGLERGVLAGVLQRTTGLAFGHDVAAWQALASGTDPQSIKPKVEPLPHIFGIPILGRRVVLLVDKSLRFGDLHRFAKPDRIREVCEVPGARGIAHFKIERVKTFVIAHVDRLLEDLPGGVDVEVVLFDGAVKPILGRFSKAGSSTRQAVAAVLEETKYEAGINSYGALSHALDMGGKTSAARWKKGPDEIVFVTVNVPTEGEIVEAGDVAAAIALRARLGQVRIHTVGILTHGYEMLRSIAAETNGIYRNYEK